MSGIFDKEVQAELIRYQKQVGRELTAKEVCRSDAASHCSVACVL